MLEACLQREIEGVKVREITQYKSHTLFACEEQDPHDYLLVLGGWEGGKLKLRLSAHANPTTGRVTDVQTTRSLRRPAARLEAARALALLRRRASTTFADLVGDIAARLRVTPDPAPDNAA